MTNARNGLSDEEFKALRTAIEKWIIAPEPGDLDPIGTFGRKMTFLESAFPAIVPTQAEIDQSLTADPALAPKLAQFEAWLEALNGGRKQ